MERARPSGILWSKWRSSRPDIYATYLYFRGTRAARVLTGLVLFLVSLTVLSEALNLVVIRWLIGRYSIFLAVALVVIFQPELRRVFAELGSRSLFAGGKKDNQTARPALRLRFRTGRPSLRRAARHRTRHRPAQLRRIRVSRSTRRFPTNFC